ncbi:MAG: hypothetical protein ACRD7E_19970 [Bryobacteraceae bacterium]
MQQLVYAMQFKGKAEPSTEKPGTIKVRSEAASASITNLVNSGGLTGGFDPSARVDASYESDVQMTGDDTFVETGVLTFGAGNTIRFSTYGQGRIGPSPDSSLRQGSVVWKIEGGKGQMDGAGGLITCNFTITEDGEVSDHQMGVLYIK